MEKYTLSDNILFITGFLYNFDARTINCKRVIISLEKVFLSDLMVMIFLHHQNQLKEYQCHEYVETPVLNGIRTNQTMAFVEE